MTTETENRNILEALTSVPNFRPLRSTFSASPQPACLFRSSRPDRIEQCDLFVFKALGIQSILDFRSPNEYFSADGSHLLDGEYHLYVVEFPRGRNYRHNEPVKLKSIATKLKYGCSIDSGRRHYLINFFSPQFVWEVFFKRAPWYVRLYSLLCLLYDIIFGTGYKHFARLFASEALNPAGLVGQYKYIIDFSQKSICAALKLLCNTQNLPALMNCAHGKDRTGIVSALILCCLGESHTYIADEYALSNAGLAAIKTRIFKEMVEVYRMKEEFTTASAETMQELIEYIINKYGSVEDYLVYIGFGFQEQEMLRQNLLGKSPIVQDVSSSLDYFESLSLMESSIDDD